MKNNTNSDNILDYGSGIIAIIILVMGVLRIINIDDNSKKFDEITLLYFIAVPVVFSLKYIKKLKFGSLEVELEFKKELEAVKRLAGIAEDNVNVFAPGHPIPVSPGLVEMSGQISMGNVPDDPWKGVFGGKSLDKVNGRLLTAEVDEITESPGWYSVILKVSGLPDHLSLEGEVQFYIHDSFPNHKPVIEARNNVAMLHLKAWGAFTVGVLADEGKTKLELDLAELKTAPLKFRLI